MGEGTILSDRPNIVRLFIGEKPVAKFIEERFIELSTNIDDMNPQRYGDISDRLFAAGALDVAVTPIQMKKGRPGVTLNILAEPEKVRRYRKNSVLHTQQPSV